MQMIWKQSITGHGSFENEKVNIIFNRDILMNEGEIIDNCQKSSGLISNETIIGKHPWVDDPKLEMQRLEEQKQKQQEEAAAMYEPFGQQDDEQQDAEQQEEKADEQKKKEDTGEK